MKAWFCWFGSLDDSTLFKLKMANLFSINQMPLIFTIFKIIMVKCYLPIPELNSGKSIFERLAFKMQGLQAKEVGTKCLLILATEV